MGIFNDTQFAEVKVSDYRRVNQLTEFIGKNRSPTKMIETSKDWEVADALIKFWKKEQPEEYAFFKRTVAQYRKAYDHNQHGVKEEKGGASIQHLLEVPERLHKIFMSVYPMQRWDRKFIRQFIDRFPEFRLHRHSKI